MFFITGSFFLSFFSFIFFFLIFSFHLSFFLSFFLFFFFPLIPYFNEHLSFFLSFFFPLIPYFNQHLSFFLSFFLPLIPYFNHHLKRTNVFFSQPLSLQTYIQTAANESHSSWSVRLDISLPRVLTSGETFSSQSLYILPLITVSASPLSV
ncbi:unnamed protein product [Acanthosepion pharaonis]|uniref:Uncharacterized protein n=1 Tax=Acanthosepion pharaonis TaxID=158019 RepID=A0A812C9U6_ACAPH|nr:unnamed protein product [Sepia pharaonis]